MDMLQLNQELINFAIVALTGLVGWVTKSVASYLNKKGLVAQMESHKQLVSLVVNGVEQAYTQLHGKEKLNMAKIELIKLANARGIKIDEKELDIMIEAVVKEMNSSVKAEITNVDENNK